MNEYFNLSPDGRLLITDIHPDAAIFMSKVFSDLARQLENSAEEKKRKKLETVAAITHRRHVDVLVAMMIEHGKSLDQAICELRHYGVPDEHSRFLWREIKPRVERSQLRARRTTARRMRRNGYSNGEIARKLNCSVRTVNRLLEVSKGR
ncbi:hypothetical protein [Kordiimonas gwangyangensis]|uniref:hypothetical protein n=1 Tax=Kordiimonas gwangyangensis TaxID=288022 RepID=UPI0012DD6A24|nr:hypothetical protein [Kordiimonas gwangyangensis]